MTPAPQSTGQTDTRKPIGEQTLKRKVGKSKKPLIAYGIR